MLAKIDETESYEARKLARRELRRAGRMQPSAPPVARPPASPADPSPRIRSSPVAAAVGRNSPCPLRERPQVQEMLRSVMAKGRNGQRGIRSNRFKIQGQTPGPPRPPDGGRSGNKADSFLANPSERDILVLLHRNAQFPLFDFSQQLAGFQHLLVPGGTLPAFKPRRRTNSRQSATGHSPLYKGLGAPSIFCQVVSVRRVTPRIVASSTRVLA